MSESSEQAPSKAESRSTLSDEEISRRLGEKTSSWDKTSDAPARVEPTPEQLAGMGSRLDDGKLHPKKGVPDWAYAFKVGEKYNINGFVCRVAGHYVDDVSEEPIGFVLIPEERTAAYMKRMERQAKSDEVAARRKGIKAVKK